MLGPMAEATAASSRRVLVALALLGAASAAFQTLFARELMVGFSGDETVIAAVLGPWLLATALGAALGRAPGLVAAARARRAHVVLLGYGPLAALGLVAARLLPLTFAAGAAPGAALAFVASLILLAPACVLSGAAFSLLLGLATDEAERAVARSLWVESLGSAAAGAALSLWLVGHVPALSLGFLAAALAAGAALVSARRKLGSALLVLATSILALLPVDRWAWSRSAPALRIAESRQSPVASILVARDHGASTVLVNRAPVASSDDRARAEELVHLPLALVSAPKRALFVGVPPAGAFELLRAHGVVRIDWLIEDGVLAEVLEREIRGLRAPDVHRSVGDARATLRARRGLYDAILMDLPEPRSTQENRAFTQEELEVVAASLAPNGVLAVALPGHAEYASLATRRLHSSIRTTLQSVMGPVRVAPLGSSLYLGRAGAELEPLDPTRLADTLDRRGIPARTPRFHDAPTTSVSGARGGSGALGLPRGAAESGFCIPPPIDSRWLGPAKRWAMSVWKGWGSWRRAWRWASRSASARGVAPWSSPCSPPGRPA